MKKNLMKKFLLVLSCLLAMGLLAACSDSDQKQDANNANNQQNETELTGWAYIENKGELIVGLDDAFAPMGFRDEDGNLVGFDIDLANAAGEYLGLDVTFKPIDWDAKDMELSSKRIDCIWNGLTLDAEREANLNCTVPYVKNAQVVVVKSGTDYTDTSSLAGKTVVAEVGSAGEAQIIGTEDSEPDAGLAQADYVGKSVQTDCLMEVKAGTADAAVLDLTLANAMTGEGTDYADLEIVDELAVENYGVAFRKGSDIRDAVNDIFAEMVADGSLKALADQYNLELAE